MKRDIQVYQIYYQEDQKEHLFGDALPLFNENLGLYFENDIILDLYRRGCITGDYFGVLSWKARIKNHVRSKSLERLISRRYDLYSFTYDRHDVLGYAEICHPGFREIFRELLAELGLQEDNRPLVGLYQNAVITTPEIYTDYVENFLLPTVNFFEQGPDNIKEMLFTDAGYRGVGGDQLADSLGVEHYTFHTFILERLWSLYYHVRRNKKSISYYWMQINPHTLRSVQVNSKGRLHKFNL